MGDTDIETDVRLVKHQKNEFIMRVGKHKATVICRNKREGKQKAAQAILQLLHPQITSWGSLLRLYGRGSCKTPKEKKVFANSSQLDSY
jgi:microprocessor complex subunit DGCR8